MSGQTAFVVLALLLTAASPSRSQEPADPWVGRPLAEALDDLLDRGLLLVYTSEVVRPDMLVEVEPSARSLPARLEQLLAPHDLTGRAGPGGHLLVVPATDAPLSVTLLSPRSGDVTTGTVDVEALVTGDEPVSRLELLVDGRRVSELDRPPWSASVELAGEGPEWQIDAIAHGVRGGVDRATVTTRSVVFRDRVNVALHKIYVNVRRTRFSGDLGPEHFRIVGSGDGQRERAPFSVEPARVPLSAAVLIDTSESMAGTAIEAAARGAESLLRQLSPADEAMVLLFSEGVRAITPFSRNPETLTPVLEGLDASGGTAVNDHLYAALRLLDQAEGWPVVVLLSDGADLLSALPMAAVRRKVDASGAAIYWLRLTRGASARLARTRASTAWRDADANQREHQLLEEAVRASGGRLLDLDSPSEIGDAFDEILAELNEQYVLSYEPIDGSPVAVRSTLPGIELRWWPLESGGSIVRNQNRSRRISGVDPH